MVNFSTLATLAGLAAGQTVDPTVTLSASGVSVNLQLDGNTLGELVKLDAGTCTETSSDISFVMTDVAGDGQYALDIDIAACGLVLGSNVTFEIGGTTMLEHTVGETGTNNVTVTFYEYQFTLDQEYTYEIRYSYGKVNTNVTVLTPNDLGLDFHLVAYDQTYGAENNISDRRAGEMIYLGLTVDSSITFDHDAYNFAINTCKIRKVGGSVEYTFLDHARDNCGNDLIGLKVDYDSSVNMWKFEHLLFLLSGEHGQELEIICEVKVCPSGLSGSTCGAIATECLACKDSQTACGSDRHVCQASQDMTSAVCTCPTITDTSGTGLLSGPVQLKGATCEEISFCDFAALSAAGDICALTAQTCDDSCVSTGTCNVPNAPFLLNGDPYTLTGYSCV